MKRPVVPIAIALLIALVAGLLVFIYARSAEDRALQQQQPVTVLLSAGVIPQGTTLGDASSAGLVKSTEVAQALRPPGALTEVTSANAGLVALAEMPAGQTLMESSFGVTVPATAPLAVPDGKVAVSVLMDDPGKVGTFLRPGSQIAVFDTSAENSADAKSATMRTRVLLDRVLVLAIGDVTAGQEQAATAESWQAQLVTLAVSQTEAEKVVHAVQTGGKLYMTLLSDTATLSPTDGVSDQDLFN